jgi:phenylpyruvate tautomerase PptA (4-oxalocrotonate tautomerase family)
VTTAALAERIGAAWLAAFGRQPDAVTVHGDEVRVEGRWGVGMLATIPPEAPGEPSAEGVIPQSESNTVEDALFRLLTIASVADEARRALEGRQPRWTELMGPF